MSMPYVGTAVGSYNLQVQRPMVFTYSRTDSTVARQGGSSPTASPFLIKLLLLQPVPFQLLPLRSKINQSINQ